MIKRSFNRFTHQITYLYYSILFNVLFDNIWFILFDALFDTNWRIILYYLMYYPIRFDLLFDNIRCIICVPLIQDWIFILIIHLDSFTLGLYWICLQIIGLGSFVFGGIWYCLIKFVFQIIKRLILIQKYLSFVIQIQICNW